MGGKFIEWRRGVFDLEPKYYVYRWFRIQDGYTFYIGKGSGKRYQDRTPTKRNRYFSSYIAMYDVEVEIVVAGLTEKEAFELEKKLIDEYRKRGECCCNFAEGGAENGNSHLSGALNPMYGKTHTFEARQKIREANLHGRNAGKNNSQYGISPQERMSKEQYKKWRENHKNINRSRNPNAKIVKMYNIINDELVQSFSCIIDCAEFLQKYYSDLNNKDINLIRRIPENHPKNKPFRNFYFEIIKPIKGNTVPSL